MKNPNTLRSHATYNDNIEFVDLTDKLPGDVQLQNLARRKCAFQIDEGCSYCDYNVVITENYNSAIRGDFLDDKDYYIECDVKDYTKAPWGRNRGDWRGCRRNRIFMFSGYCKI